MKKCHYCAEKIQNAALVCKHCGKDQPKSAWQQNIEKAKKMEEEKLSKMSEGEKEEYLEKKKGNEQTMTIIVIVIVIVGGLFLLLMKGCMGVLDSSGGGSNRLDLSDEGLEEFRKSRQQYEHRQDVLDDYNELKRSVD